MLMWISQTVDMRRAPTNFETTPAHPLPDHPELSEVFRALASVTREERVRSGLMKLAEDEEGANRLSSAP